MVALLISAVLSVAVVRAIAAQESGELPRKGFLGVRLAPAPDEIRKGANLGEGEGVLIESIIPGTTAADGDIHRGDVIVAIDGLKVRGPADVMKVVAPLVAGHTLELTFLRAGQRMTKSLTLEERPRDRGVNFDVLYHVASHGVRIRTIVTKPHGDGRHPVLFLIQGLGPATIDEPLDGPGAYSRILSHFAGSGFVTVRVEKPGLGDSEGGPYVDTDFDAELDIYRQALIALKQYDFVDPEAVFIFGHSIGGVFGPIIAGEIPVRGVAVYGTVAKTWTEYFLENTRRQALLGGGDPIRVDATLRDLAAVSHLLIVEQKTREEVVALRPGLRGILDRFVPGGRISGRAARFWSQLASQNLPAHWAKGNAHVLAIWGRHDFISTEADHPLIADTVNRARPGKGMSATLDDSDHGFRRTTSVEDSYQRWKSPDGEFNPAIITTLKQWIQKVRR